MRRPEYDGRYLYGVVKAGDVALRGDDRSKLYIYTGVNGFGLFESLALGMK